MDALDLRKKLKSRKPSFRRQDAHKKDRLSRTGYRKPRGRQSKMRLHKRGYARVVSVGYGSPAEAKDLHPTGYMPFIINTLAELDNLDPKKEGVMISSTVGLKKKLAILQRALELKLKVLNVKDPAAFIEETEKQMKEKKAKKTSEKKKREEKKKKEAEKKSSAKESEKDDEGEVEKKAAEKKEKDKVLTRKED